MVQPLDYQKPPPDGPENFPLWLAALATFTPVIWMWWIAIDTKRHPLIQLAAVCGFVVNVIVVLVALILLLKRQKIRPRKRAIWVRDVYWWWFIMGMTVTLFVLALEWKSSLSS